MAITDLTPPITEFSAFWDLFTFNLGSAFGFTTVLGLAIWALTTWLVLRRKGTVNAAVFAIISIPIIVEMGWFPTWAKLISYILVVLFGVRLYVQATEGL